MFEKKNSVKTAPIEQIEGKYPFVWLLLGLVLVLLSYGIFNTGICAWIFAIPLIRYINIRKKWSSILMMLVGMIVVANIAFFRLVEDNVNIMNQVFCTFNGIRIWFPFFIYFLCRKLNTKKLIAYFAFPASVAVAEFFIDNPFVSVMTSLSVSQFWNLGLMQVASVTGVVGVSFIVTFVASVVNYVWEEGLRKKFAFVFATVYIAFVIVVTGLGMESANKITTLDKTVRVATAVDDMGVHLAEYINDNNTEGFYKLSMETISKRASEAVGSGAAILVFPEDAFMCPEENAEDFLEEVKNIAGENNINILLPLLRVPEEGKRKNTLNFISRNGELLNTYTKNHLVPVVEEPVSERGDGKTPIIEVDGIKITYLICADYTSNKYAYNGREADIFLNPSYDWKAFEFFTSYGVQARAIECGYSVLRNPVNGNIILYDYHGRPIHMSNAMDVHEGMIYCDVPCKGRTTVYGTIGNVFPWLCLVFALFALLSGLFIKEKKEEI